MGFEPAISRLFKQAALTTALGSLQVVGEEISKHVVIHGEANLCELRSFFLIPHASWLFDVEKIQHFITAWRVKRPRGISVNEKDHWG